MITLILHGYTNCGKSTIQNYLSELGCAALSPWQPLWDFYQSIYGRTSKGYHPKGAAMSIGEMLKEEMRIRHSLDPLFSSRCLENQILSTEGTPRTISDLKTIEEAELILALGLPYYLIFINSPFSSPSSTDELVLPIADKLIPNAIDNYVFFNKGLGLPELKKDLKVFLKGEGFSF